MKAVSSVLHEEGGKITVKVEAPTGAMLFEIKDSPTTVAEMLAFSISDLTDAQYEALEPQPIGAVEEQWIKESRNAFDSLWANLG